eukprot:Rhum_TRINITY_DN14827_c15_g1::Rhum_TRINITY_DN14827_c15_g1_i1::g.122135::m.122135/K14050/RABGGTA; geranylgeranyl transferase type-2 subunit alpha
MHDRKREELNDVGKKKLAAKITAYKELCKTCMALRKQRVYTPEALKLLDKILMVNPEFYTMWNYRRELLQALLEADCARVVHGDAGAVSGVVEPRASVASTHMLRELRFNGEVIETRDHKSYCVWHHRRWVIQALECSEARTAQLQTELGLCAELLRLDDRNFHCWGHRMWVVERLRAAGLHSDADELAFTQERVEANFSNYSAYHARSKVLGGGGGGSGAVADEVEMVQNAFYTEASDQSGWIYGLWLLAQEEARNEEQKGKEAAPTPVAETVESAATELLEDDADLKWPRLVLAHQGKLAKSDMVTALQSTDPLRAGYYHDVALAE